MPNYKKSFNPAKKLYKKLVLSIMETRVYLWALKHVIPYIRFTTYYTSLRGWKYKRGYALLEPGDIILTHDKKKLTSMLIPGEFAHAALCVAKGHDVEFEIAEMTHSDYTKSAFFDICKESDRVVIMRCEDWDADYTQQVINNCLSYSDAVYDPHFNFGDHFLRGVRALYCSELIIVADTEKRLDVCYDDFAGIGQEYISPLGLYHAKNKQVIWDSDKETQ